MIPKESQIWEPTWVRYPATAGATTPIMFAAQLVIPSNVPAKLDAMSRWTHLVLHQILGGKKGQKTIILVKTHMNPAY